MRLRRVRRMLSAVLAGCLISTMTVSAGDVQSTSQEESAVSDLAGAGGEEQPEEDGAASGMPGAGEGETPGQDGENIKEDAVKDQRLPENDQQDQDAANENKDSKESDELPEKELGDMPGSEGAPDAATQALLDEYERLLRQARAQAVGSYSTELAKFPASYQTYLKQLHAKHPNWIFVAMNSSLKWNDIVAAESVSSSTSGANRSLLPKTSEGILLSKAGTDYNASKGTYIPKDGSTWVSASKPAVAYYADPRNFLTDNYIYMFEALNYNAGYHQLGGVQNVLKGTDLGSGNTISYMDTNGKTVPLNLTYSQAIYAAGQRTKVSPLFLAAKIRQETGGSLKNGSISGNYSYGGKSYRGYYNFYNIGAYSTSTGSAIANGLNYARGGSSYGRPWNSPVKAIDGGALYLASAYISRGQNTVYYQKFNTISSPYYQHQYMQNLTAAASEAKTTYNAYNNMGIVNNANVFYIPVYKDMPSQTASVTVKKSVKTGKTTSDVTLRKGPSSGYSSLGTVPKGKTVTLSGAVYTDMDVSVSSQEKNPYWFKVAYGGKSGYISSRYVQPDADSTVKAGAEKQLSVSVSSGGGKVYYETSNPAVATVDSGGKVKGVKAGNCTVYAVTGSGKQMDAVGIAVSGTASSSLGQPKLSSVSNSKSGIVIKWKKVSGAKGYYIYRKSGGGWKKIKKITSGSTVKYTDKSMSAGKKHAYTVRAYNGSKTSSYDKKGLTIRRLTNPSMVSAKGSKSGVKVKWKKVKSAVTYDVYRKKSGGKYTKIATVKGGSKVTYTDKKAKKGVTYYYTARACSGIYKGAYTTPGVKGKRK